jgi:hypothetical protein
MTTYYVSNTASNGYVVGNDSNAGTSPATAWLTIAKATTTASSGSDVININPSATPYVENSGSGYLNWSYAGTLQADPAYWSTSNYVTIQSSSNVAARVLNLNSVTGAQVIAGILFDAQSHSGKVNISPAEQRNLTVRQCKFINSSASGACIGQASGTLSNITVDRCIVDPTITLTAFRCGITGVAYTFKGCTFSGVSRIIQIADNGSTLGSLTLSAADDGTLNTFNGATARGIEIASANTTGVVTNISITGCSLAFNGSGSVFFNVPAGTTLTSTTCNIFGNSVVPFNTTTAAINIQGKMACSNFNVYSNTGSGSSPLTDIRSEDLSNVNIHDNTYTNTASAPISVQACGSGLLIQNNTVVTGGGTYAIQVGTDGYINDVSNTTLSSTQKFGDVAGDTYIAQSFVTSSINSQSHNSYLTGIIVYMAKVLSPTGTINCYLYSNSAGQPGSLVATATTTVSAASVAGSASQYGFIFRGTPYKMTAGGTYHLVVKISGGSTDSSNYINLSTNTAYASGNINKSSDGVTWTADSSNDLAFIVQTGPLGITGGVVSGNLVSTVLGTETPHGVFVGSTQDVQVYRNKVIGTGIPIIYKQTVGNSSAACYDNLVWTNVGTQQALRGKAAYNVSFYQNTVILQDAAAYTAQFDNDSNNSVVNNPYCDLITFKNNIVYRTASSNSGSVYNVPSGNTNMSIDYNCVYAGSNTTISLQQATWAGWQGLGYDTHGVNANPLLYNAATASAAADFIPAISSPAKAIGAANPFTASDYAGNPFGLKPDAGAYSIFYYASLSANGSKLVWNAINNTQFLDYSGLTGAVAGTQYDPLMQSVTTTGNITIPAKNGIYQVFADATSGAITVTMNDAALYPLTRVTVIKTDSSNNYVTITPTNAQTINGASTQVLMYQNRASNLESDGTNWRINANSSPPQITKTVTTQFDTTSTTLADVTGLSVNVVAGLVYAFEAILYTSSNIGGGVKAAIAGTATATSVVYEAVTFSGGAVVAETRATSLATAVGAVTAVTAALMRITGTITVNASGTLTVQFAENVAVSTSSVLVGSSFTIRQANV